MIPRERIRDLSIACRLACHTGGAISGKPLHDIAEVLETPTWFSANELRLAADAMDILGTATADGWTLRARLDAFWKPARSSRTQGASRRTFTNSRVAWGAWRVGRRAQERPHHPHDDGHVLPTTMRLM